MTIRELQSILGISSPSVVHHHIQQLEKKGYLRRNPSNPQDYQILATDPEKRITYVNVYGLAQCGPKGSLLDGNPVDRIAITSRLLGFSSKEAFIVRAQGDSMIPKISPGDLVIVQKSHYADNGEVVICVNKGEALIKQLIKQLIKEEDQIILQSYNKKYSPFLAAKDFRIEGKVKGIISYSL